MFVRLICRIAGSPLGRKGHHGQVGMVLPLRQSTRRRWRVMDWHLIALHVLKTALHEAARQLASAAERRHERGAE